MSTAAPPAIRYPRCCDCGERKPDVKDVGVFFEIILQCDDCNAAWHERKAEEDMADPPPSMRTPLQKTRL